MKAALSLLVCVFVCVPAVASAQGEPQVRGYMDKAVIRRVVREHHKEAIYCYEEELAKDPELAGKISVKFVIGEDGGVKSAAVSESTLGNGAVGECVTKAVRRWVFPEPKGGGIVVVTYPFVFSSGQISRPAPAIGNWEAGEPKGMGFGGLGLSGPTRHVPPVSLEAPDPSEEGEGTVEGSIAPGERPVVVTGKPVVKGALDKEIIRRVVRRHRNEIRYCYEEELEKDPKLAGEVKVKFVIGKDGSVKSAVVADSTLGSSAVESCVTKRVKRWVFPEPKGGGVVVVSYPFSFSSGATESEGASSVRSR